MIFLSKKQFFLAKHLEGLYEILMNSGEILKEIPKVQKSSQKA